MYKAEETQYYKIGEISKLCNVPIRTLHYYDDINLLKPAKVDSVNNYRYYEHSQLRDINTIKYFKAAGCTLDEIKKLIKKNDLAYSQDIIRKKSDKIEADILRLTALKSKLNAYLCDMTTSNGRVMSPIEIAIQYIEASAVAFSRYAGPCTPEDFYLRFSQLTNMVEKNKLSICGTMMAIYHDDYKDFNYENADVEVCVKVRENYEDHDGVRRFGGFLGVVAYHYGSYDTMHTTYEKMLKWLEKQNLVFLGSAVENYIIDVVTTNCEEDFITEIILPVKTKE